MISAWKRVVFVVSLGVATAHAEDTDLSAERVGQIQYQEKKALEEVQSQYGNRKPSEMSQDERREMIDKQKEVLSKVHESAGVSDKDYARRTAHMSPDELSAAKQAERAAEREELKKEVKAESSAGPEVVPYEEATGQKPPPSQPVTTKSNSSRHSSGGRSKHHRRDE